MTPFKARALASLAEVVTTALVPHLDVLLPALFPAIAADAPDEHDAAVEAAVAVSGAVDEAGVHLLLGELHLGVLADEPLVRKGAAELVGIFCTSNGRVDMEERCAPVCPCLCVSHVGPIGAGVSFN